MTADGANRSLLRSRRLLEIPAAVVLVLMVLHVTANAVVRTVTGSSLPETLEVTSYWYLPAVVLIGFVAAARRNEHIAASLLHDRLPNSMKPAVDTVLDGLSAAVCAAFAWYGAQEAFYNAGLELTAGVSPLPVWPMTFLVPLSFGLLAAHYVARIVVRLRSAAVAASAGTATSARTTHGEGER